MLPAITPESTRACQCRSHWRGSLEQTSAHLAAARDAAGVEYPLSLLSGAVAEQLLEALHGKLPLIKKTYRPPNYETPISYFNEEFTPNNAFFVRYHLADIPEVDAAAWKVRVGGPAVQNPA